MTSAGLATTPEVDRATWVLRVVLVTAIVVSIFHYTDNYIRFDEYPQDEPELVSRPMVPLSWLVFTVFGIIGYRLFRQGRRQAAAVCLAIYSISGLVSPLHYTSGALSEFDAFQHVNIAADGVVGLAVFGFACWLLLTKEAPALGARRSASGAGRARWPQG